MKMHLRDSNLFYLHLRDGEAVDTITLNDGVYMEIDTEGRPLSIEAIDIADLVPFLRERGGTFHIPDQIDPTAPEWDGPPRRGFVGTEADAALLG
ncbi:MAG: DUF2283 domain-containing protein [Chloroflexia bacterium]|nr:DUF2283 domain-containing protein [Chloroflexia bacterium]MDQ3512874.1 DUF2283 domain-containing protein [Chloroflexota bacterium]